MSNFRKIFAALALVLGITVAVMPQTTAFSLQGSLTSSGGPANGSHDFEFLLFDALDGGSQLGTTLTRSNVFVTNGVFAVSLDFGSEFPGEERFLEVHVRLSDSGPFTPLTPRQAVNSSPYAIKSIAADNASNAVTADNALQLGGVAANQFVLTGDTRLSDARNPLPGSASYIQNQNAGPQAGSNFDISGTGTANIFNVGSQYNINGGRILAIGGTAGLPNSNLFVGVNTGPNNSGCCNSFVGSNAGLNNTTGFSNSFFGTQAGLFNTTGGSNSFLGVDAGQRNTIGNANSFVGQSSGHNNLSGSRNSFVGFSSGIGNTTGNNNTMAGFLAGGSNTTGVNLTIIGANADVASNNLSFATAIGAGAIVSTSNTVRLGRAADSVEIPGALNLTGTLAGSIINAATQFNIGGNRVLRADANQSTYLGFDAGAVATGFSNSFFGSEAGEMTTTGASNSFFGGFTGFQNMTGNQNSFFGQAAGAQNITGNDNSFFGFLTGNINQTGSRNAFFGASAGNIGQDTNAVSLFGHSANSSPNLSNATSLGANAFVSQNNSLVLGSINGINGATADTNVGIGTTAPSKRLTIGEPESTLSTAAVGVFSTAGTGVVVRETTNDIEGVFLVNNNGAIYGATTDHAVQIRTNNVSRFRISNTGLVSIFNLGAPGSTSLCRNASDEISTCTAGNLPEGSPETLAAFGALREQVLQMLDQLKRQQAEIDTLRSHICAQSPTSAFCKPGN